MTIRKLWLIILIIVSVLSVGVNSLILSTLTDKYFKDFLVESYDNHLNQIIDYSKRTLSSEDISLKQMEMELEGHLTDPIIEIKLYSPDGTLLVNVSDDYYISNDMMPGMMRNFLKRDSANEVKQYELQNSGKLIGVLNITSHSVAENSFVARKFKSSLLINTLVSILLVSPLMVLLGIMISKKMSKSMIETANMASSIQQGAAIQMDPTNIMEVNAIRDSLNELDTRLKLKQKSRKALVDGLVHQTRTPLTILKTHIEAIEDGFIKATDTELAICQNQVENLTTIISNMSGMIDANKEVDEIKFEWVNVDAMIKQIVSGLKTLFETKSVELHVISTVQQKVFTDKYKLSQSIFNLLINANKYTHSGGEVSVSTFIEGDHLFIEVKDTGIGIKKEEKEKVFNAYYRGSNVTATNGDGIGLYIVKENIERIGGRISVQSDLGNGSVFLIEISIDSDASI